MNSSAKPTEKKTAVEVHLSAKAIGYLDLLVEKEGFGDSRREIVERAVWHVLNNFIQSGRLPNEIDGGQK